MTNHLSDEELILHYYGEADRADEPRIEAHLAECGHCQVANAQLRRVLTLVETAAPVAARPGFERDVWARLEPRLDAKVPGFLRRLVPRSLGDRGRVHHSAKREAGPVHHSAKRDGGWFPQWALAGGVAALVFAAFMAGRFSGGVPAASLVEATPSLGLPADRVLHAAVGDHLDRTQMMLAELVNNDVNQGDVFAGEQARASDLVAANRLIRQSATQSGDAGVADVLEDLERVLLEIANAPADVTSNQLSDLKARITAQDLLFRVRVIASEMRNRTRTDREAGDRLPQRPPIS